MRNRMWMAVFVVGALGLAACGDSGADTGEADAMAEEMADDADAAMNDMADGDAMNGMSAPDGDAMQELPQGVTMAMVTEGKTVYEGVGICSSCHGPAGQGVPNLGANLADDEWVHSEGDFEGIVATIMNGVTADASTSGIPMPAKAGTSITDAQVRAAAAYVWTLSH